jgi:hypothetical protein
MTRKIRVEVDSMLIRVSCHSTSHPTNIQQQGEQRRDAAKSQEAKALAHPR